MYDEKLITELRRKDESALETVMKGYYAFVSTVIANTSKGILTSSDIEETAADVFYCLWKNTDKVSAGTLKGYLCSIAKSKTKDKLRSLKIVNTLDIEDMELMDSFCISDNMDREAVHNDIAQALSQFNDDDREILIRYYYYYQTAPKIAEIKGMKLEAVKSRIKRARPKLKAFLKERGY